MPASYRIEHTTRYVYTSPVTMSQHMAFLQPRELPYQHVRAHELRIEPAPATLGSRSDYFGNQVYQFQVLQPHSTLVVSAESVVDVTSRFERLDTARSPRWDEVSRELTRRASVIPADVVAFAFPSPYLPMSPEAASLARHSFPPGTPMLAGAVDLVHRIHHDFTFDPTATTVTTPLARMIEDGRGVCQDFAHLAVSCLRSLGLAARYVSGYLLTDPPVGQPRLVGADASHAWVSVYCPAHGWVDLDPTNDVIVGERHVTAAWGRDYGDVSPLRGVLLGGAQHALYVSVSVLPLNDVGVK
jgi:transglutaminase-like putative cysteine protease